MKRAKIIMLLCGMCVLVQSTLLSANEVDVDFAIKYRQYVMRTQAGHLKAITTAIEGNLPFKSHFLAHAESLYATTQFMTSIFPPGSDIGSFDTDAKALIWNDWSGFTEKVTAAQRAAIGLRQAVIGGEDGEIVAAAVRMNDACKACHRRYRSR